MTQDLRSRAIQAGWDLDVANSLDVTFNGRQFTSNVHPDFIEQAFEYEVGSEDTRATAVLRKFVADPADGAKTFSDNFSDQIRGLK